MTIVHTDYHHELQRALITTHSARAIIIIYLIERIYDFAQEAAERQAHGSLKGYKLLACLHKLLELMQPILNEIVPVSVAHTILSYNDGSCFPTLIATLTSITCPFNRS